jgi:D-arabinose 1-dehydrogenase-like Zn-dependent alcohol dehydrogenase
MDIKAAHSLSAKDRPNMLAGPCALGGPPESLRVSNIGGIPETQEMLDVCGANNITADVEVIPIQKVNEAYERLLRSDVK